MARMTDIDELLEKVAKIQASDGSQEKRVGEIIQAITKSPTVELVRCKDCKHFWNSFSGTHSCKLHKGLVGTKYDTFCSYGEKKDGDGNV